MKEAIVDALVGEKDEREKDSDSIKAVETESSEDSENSSESEERNEEEEVKNVDLDEELKELGIDPTVFDEPADKAIDNLFDNVVESIHFYRKEPAKLADTQNNILSALIDSDSSKDIEPPSPISVSSEEKDKFQSNEYVNVSPKEEKKEFGLFSQIAAKMTENLVDNWDED